MSAENSNTPAEYDQRYISAVNVTTPSNGAGAVAATMKDIGTAVTAGQSVIYQGTCGATGMTWDTSTSIVDPKFLPKL